MPAAIVRSGGQLPGVTIVKAVQTTAEGGGSIGRAAVSKTAGCRFESCPPCKSGTFGAGARSTQCRKVVKVAKKIIDEPSEDIVANARKERAQKRGPFGRFSLFIRQVIGELRKVVTPTRRELTTYTLVVLVFVIIMMAIVGGLDWVWAFVVKFVFGGPEVP